MIIYEGWMRTHPPKNSRLFFFLCLWQTSLFNTELKFKSSAPLALTISFSHTFSRVMTSKIFKKVSSSHDDIIHDLVYDFYGKRIASCSSDQKISVWDIDENQEWTRSYSWKAHNALVCKLDWALPEFGQVIASCSHDRKVIIWEEIESMFSEWFPRIVTYFFRKL